MIVKIKMQDGTFLYRNVLRGNQRKIAKNIHKHFPESDYPTLEAIIFNAMNKEQNLLVRYPHKKEEK